MSVAAVIVTYNRKKLLVENLKQIVNQTYKVDKIVIIDNHGSDNTYEYIKSNKDIDFNLIDYVYLENNIGGAGGFYTGVKRCFDQQYDWIILMDDDGKPYDKYTFEKIFEYINNNNLNSDEPILLNSLVIVDLEKLSFGLCGTNFISKVREQSQNGIIRNEVNTFNGSCLSRGLIKKIGYPNKEFFIKGDEVEYMNRANKSNAFVATVIDSLYYHPSVNSNKFLKVGKKQMELYVEKPWKEYYTVRNYTYMYSLDKDNIAILKLFFRRMVSVFLCKCPKMKTIKMIFLGLKDGVKHSLGAKIKP